MDRSLIILTLTGLAVLIALAGSSPGLSPLAGAAALAGWLAYALAVHTTATRAR